MQTPYPHFYQLVLFILLVPSLTSLGCGATKGAVSAQVRKELRLTFNSVDVAELLSFSIFYLPILSHFAALLF